MHIRCPHCRIALEIVADKPVEELSCPSCGERLERSLMTDDTLSVDRQLLRPIAHFTLLDFLGHGAFGAVWKAHDTKLDRLVALKIPRKEQFDAETFESFAREARAAAQVNHPHIVTVYEIGREGDVIYIASEFIDGVSLRDRLKTKKYAPAEAAELCAPLAEALHQAHAAGVVHRDLKPGNVLIDGQGRPHLTDFGLAKRDNAEMTIAADGQILGTIAYMSPEQAAGHGHSADCRSDVYSLGVILYELMAGRKPFQGESRLLLHQVQHDEPVRPRQLERTVPGDLETICLKALEKDPRKRYPTAQEMAEDLRRFLRGEPIRARPVTRLERTWRWCRRNPALAATGAVAILAVLVLAAVLVVPRSPRPVLRRVRLQTEPAGATIVFHPLTAQTGAPQPERAIRPPRTRADRPTEVALEPGDYLVVAVAQSPGYSFHEVYRRVPAPGMTPGMYPHDSWQDGEGGDVVLPPIRIPLGSATTGMTFFAGGERVPIGRAGSMDVPLHERSVPGFWLDPTEVRVGDFAQMSPNDSVFRYYEQEGLPHAADSPIAFVPWDLAVRYAEAVGKRLPTEWEYEYAATDGGTRKFPWGNDVATIADGEFGPAGQPAWDRTDTAPPVAGLFSNLAEWTCSWPTLYPLHQQAGIPIMDSPGDERIVRGAPYSVIEGRPSRDDWQNAEPRLRIAQPRKTWRRGLGFRCARSAQPRLDLLDFSRPLAGAAE